MQHWTIRPGGGVGSLERAETADREPGPGEVRVRIAAASLNARDVMIAVGHYPMPTGETVVPLSDGAGTVDATGEGVERFAPGARVVIAWNPDHISGPHRPWMAPRSLGAAVPGVLAETVIVREEALVALPEGMSFSQAACLPCAGTTAWNALFESGPPLVPGSAMVATGTGALSLIGGLIAKAAGARAVITSSDTDRIERAKAIGLDGGALYTDEDWPERTRELTGGADVVLENAGPPSIAASVRAAGPGGRVCQIGWKGMEGPSLDAIAMAMGGVSVVPIQGGSRDMLERLVAAVDVNGIEVPIAERVGFADAPRAFEAQMAEPFGKVVVEMDR